MLNPSSASASGSDYEPSSVFYNSNRAPGTKSLIARGLILVLFATLLAIFLPALYTAFDELGLPSVVEIWNQPWAAAALFDYFAGLSLSIPYLQAIGPTTSRGLLAVVLQFFLGNPVLISRAFVLVLFSSVIGARRRTGNLVSSLLPLAPGSATAPNLAGVNLLRAWSVLLLIPYIAVCVRSIIAQPIGEGWSFILHNEWAWVTFLDNLLGVVFAAVYMTIREEGQWLVLVPLLGLLAFCGSGITAIYVLLATKGAISVQDALLVRRPVVGRLFAFCGSHAEDPVAYAPIR